MSITIHLSPEVEHRPQEKASRQGQDAAEVAAAVLADALEWESLDVAEAVAGIKRGLDDFEAGRHRCFEEFEAEQRHRHLLSTTG